MQIKNKIRKYLLLTPILCLISLAAIGQNYNAQLVLGSQSPSGKPSITVQPGEHNIKVSWPAYWRNWWKVKYTYYALQPNETDPTKRTSFKTVDGAPHDFMYNPNVVKKVVHEVRYRDSDHGDFIYNVDCYNPWRWSDNAANVPLTQQEIPFLIDPDPKVLSRYNELINTGLTHSYIIEIEAWGDSYPINTDRHYFGRIIVIDSDPNYAPEHEAVITSCGQSTVDLCVNPYRFNKVNDSYDTDLTSVIPERRELRLYRVKTNDISVFPDPVTGLNNYLMNIMILLIFKMI